MVIIHDGLGKGITEELVLGLAREYIDDTGAEPNAVLLNPKTYRELNNNMMFDLRQSKPILGRKIANMQLVEVDYNFRKDSELSDRDKKELHENGAKYISVTRMDLFK